MAGLESRGTPGVWPPSCAHWSPTSGPKLSIYQLRMSLVCATIIATIIVISGETMIAIASNYWRPVQWAILISCICMVCGIIGAVGGTKRSPGFLVVFVTLMVMLFAIAISHTSQMRGEMYRTCRISQRSFKNCDPDTNSKWVNLSSCLNGSLCEAEILNKTDCQAVSHHHCEAQTEMEWMFWCVNVVTFFCAVVPVGIAILLLLRLENASSTPLYPSINRTSLKKEEEQQLPQCDCQLEERQCWECGDARNAPDVPKCPHCGAAKARTCCWCIACSCGFMMVREDTTTETESTKTS